VVSVVEAYADDLLGALDRQHSVTLTDMSQGQSL